MNGIGFKYATENKTSALLRKEEQFKILRKHKMAYDLMENMTLGRA